MLTAIQHIEQLETHLRERTRTLSNCNDPVSKTDDSFVLYWMQSAVRAEENPAFDVASELATQLNVPLLVYHALSQKYPYASDRHHAFILQGARDVQVAMQDKNVSYAFHLERSNCDGDYLHQLACVACVVVTEDMPTGPPVRFVKALKRRCSTPIIAVDTACVVPMRLVGQAFERAFEYRNKTKKLYATRIGKPWPVRTITPTKFNLTKLPFTPIDLQSRSLAKLIKQCDIDHSVGPIPDTIGGTNAGMNRWEVFKRKGLRAYAATRNDPLKSGASRLSAYLHYGMISPLRVAREAHQDGSEGAVKFLDELLIWRELAYSFCFYRPDHARFRDLPQWARKTLVEHQSDTRSQVLSWEQLARAKSGDQLWDAAQKSLLIHGELHNNVRMTWGKAILQWTQTAEQALHFLQDLNHRYALDGRDPSSYGGILWCLGQFDRPFKPEEPVFGLVRPRSTSEHASRLNVNHYQRMTSTSRHSPTPSTAVIGAGISGVIAARILADHAWPVKIFEKSRGAGGRMATRRIDGFEFDHGAQYFTARDARFQRYVDSWESQGIVAKWPGEIASFGESVETKNSGATTRYVGTPTMTAVSKHLADGLEVTSGTVISSIVRRESQWVVRDANQTELGAFDRVIVATPAPQAAVIVASEIALAQQLSSVRLSPCWAVMLTLKRTFDVPWSGAFINTGPLRWVARNQTKPGRNSEIETLVLHASSEWTQMHIDDSPEKVIANLADAFWQSTGIEPQSIAFSAAHRWRYSIPDQVLPAKIATSEDGSLICCGDWAGGPRVEGAFMSGVAAAGAILGEMADVKTR